jgi:hypothetical protein
MVNEAGCGIWVGSFLLLQIINIHPNPRGNSNPLAQWVYFFLLHRLNNFILTCFLQKGRLGNGGRVFLG